MHVRLGKRVGALTLIWNKLLPLGSLVAKIDGDGDAQLGRLEIARCKLSWGGLMVLLRGEDFLDYLRQVFAVDKNRCRVSWLAWYDRVPYEASSQLTLSFVYWETPR